MVIIIDWLLKKTIEEQHEIRVAERKALQAQINPHFLYNTLNTIKSIAKIKGIAEITTIVTQLGKLLRNAIDSKSELVTVSETIELIEGYLSIQKIRHQERLNIEISIDNEILNCKILKLIIQPIVENAIMHGLEEKIGIGNLKILGQKKRNVLLFQIIDDGIGMTKKDILLLFEGKKGIGIINVQNRIKLYYGEKYGLDIKSKLNKGTSVSIIIPYEK